MKKIKKNKKSSLRRDFEVFAKGVERLEEIKEEIDSLDTKGFEEEEKSIRSKLKNVSYIHEIEEELRILKGKINGKYKKNQRIRLVNIEEKPNLKERIVIGKEDLVKNLKNDI